MRTETDLISNPGVFCNVNNPDSRCSANTERCVLSMTHFD